MDAADGVALDLGVSSMQLDEAERGFSFRGDGPLDMRMGGEGPSAADLVNDLGEAELADILFRYGEEKRARAIARAIVRRRAEGADHPHRASSPRSSASVLGRARSATPSIRRPAPSRRCASP